VTPEMPDTTGLPPHRKTAALAEWVQTIVEGLRPPAGPLHVRRSAITRPGGAPGYSTSSSP
jgi:hypothetical protein